MTINNVSFSGYSCADAEMRTTAKGTHLCTFRLAVNQAIKNSETGEYIDNTFFIDVSLFSKNPEYIERLCSAITKGAKLVVMGSLKESVWVDKENKVHRKFSVLASKIETLYVAKSAHEAIMEDEVSVDTLTVDADALGRDIDANSPINQWYQEQTTAQEQCVMSEREAAPAPAPCEYPAQQTQGTFGFKQAMEQVQGAAHAAHMADPALQTSGSAQYGTNN